MRILYTAPTFDSDLNNLLRNLRIWVDGLGGVGVGGQERLAQKYNGQSDSKTETNLPSVEANINRRQMLTKQAAMQILEH